jgi:hypothetical protein
MHHRILTLLAMLLQLIGFSQTDTATIMYYNVLNYPGSTGSRVQYFRQINQYVKPDFVVICELVSDAGANTLLQQGLNVYGETKYQKAAFTAGPDVNNMLFYNSDKYTLYSQDTIGTTLRVINEYVLYYKPGQPVEDTIFFYLYIAHLKASTGYEQQRLAEVMHFKSHVNSMPGIENMIFGGDLNFYNASDEPAYWSLINDGLYPLNDVLPAGDWHDDDAYASIHTQSPRTAQFGGGATGGMDDRFDFILFSDDILSGSNNISYINNSCIAFGNDGQHFNKALIDSPANTSLPDSIIQALYNMSDHLPVVSKFLIQPDVVQQNYELSLKVFLEGPFNGSEMSTGINNILPLTTPYSKFPWNSTGDESVQTIPNTNIVDWILVELRDANDAASATSITRVDRQAAFLLKDGTIKSLDGSSNLQFNHSINHQLFIVIWHRNHLGVISAYPPTLAGNIFNYDFTNASNKAYLNGQNQLNTGVWGMISGDCDANGQVNLNDKSINWSSQAGKSGYFSEDLNFDGDVNNPDKNGLLISNLQQHSSIPE